MLDASDVFRRASAIQSDVRSAGLAPKRPTPPHIVALFDVLVDDADVLSCARPLFVDGHYAKAVEEAYICLDHLVQSRTGISDTGRGLMFAAFLPKDNPHLAINKLKGETHQSEQEGMGFVTGGCMQMCRNPRAHVPGTVDVPVHSLEMILWANHLMRRVKAARKRRKK